MHTTHTTTQTTNTINNKHTLNTLRVFTTNVRGLVKNWNGIKQLNLENYDIVLLNEIWQIKDFENINIERFKIANLKQRSEQRGGGSMIYIQNEIEFKQKESPYLEGVIESCAIEINNTVICSLYRPPAGCKNTAIELLLDWVETLGTKDIIIAGDWNLNYLGIDRMHYNTIENSTNLKTKIKSITRLASGTCIDNVVTNLNGKFHVSNVCIADHQGLSLEVTAQFKRKNKIDKISYREFREENWIAFNQKVARLEIRGENIEQKWDNLLSDIKVGVETSFPLKTKAKKYTFSMSQGLIKSKNKKNKLYKRYKRGLINKEEYISYNKIYRKLIFKAKENEFKEKMHEAGYDSKKKWNVLKTELKIQKTNENIDEILENDIIINTEQEIANTFKSHFETCAQNLANDLPSSGECEILFEQYPEMQFKHVTSLELEKIINGLLPKSSCGFDLLTNRMLKKEKKQFSQKLAPIINESLSAGIFPNALKIAKVIPIHKKGDKRNLNNYRPISLLPVLSKVFEKVLNKQITEHLDKFNIIDENQFGFRAGHSTEDAILKFIDRIEKELLTKKHVVSIYIDVSKAFDSCDHTILVKKLKRIGITGVSLEIMKNYLKDRIQEIWVGEKCGGRIVINIGVGQGTVLGPLLFKIYILDMYLSTNLFSIRFADDTSAIGSGDNKEDTENYVNAELDKLYKWFCNNKLTLHPDKSRFIIHTKEKQISLKLGNKRIMRCGYNLQEEGVKLLGVIIDENLDWKLQINNIKKKIGKGNYLLWRYKKLLSTNMSKTLYECFVRCHLTYCILVWGGKPSGNLTDLKKLIKRIWTKIGTRRQHTNTRLIEHGILKLEDELAMSEIKTVWRWEKNKIPNSLKSVITEKLTRQLRNRQFESNVKWKPKSISRRLAVRAKTDIKEIEQCNTKNALKNKMKQRFLNSYSTICNIRNCFICTNNR